MKGEVPEWPLWEVQVRASRFQDLGFSTEVVAHDR